MKRFVIAAASMAAIAQPALAQDSDDFRIRVGLGAQVRPEFYGGDKSEVAPLWDIDVARGDNPFSFEAPDDNFSIAAIDKNGFSVGLAANIADSRQESDVGAPVGKVKTTIEAGAFAQYMIGESVRLRAELLKGLGGHKGMVGAVGGDFVARDGDNYVFSVGPRLLFSNARYQRAFFGVSPAVALATGLPAYEADGGVHAVAVASGLSYQFSKDFGLFGFGRWERLVGDAGKSPIVRQLGSRNQMSAGVGLSYTFTMAR